MKGDFKVRVRYAEPTPLERERQRHYMKEFMRSLMLELEEKQNAGKPQKRVHKVA